MYNSIITDITTWFFTSLGLDFSDIQVHVQDAEKNIYGVHISSQDSALLIGLHGKTLEEIQCLIMQMVEKESGTHCMIHLEVNDYLAEKEKRLMAIVDSKVSLALRNGLEQVIYDLTGFERKQVHAYISEKYPNIATKSFDGDRGRELHVMLREGVLPTGDTVSSAPRVTKSSDIAEDLSKIDLDGTNI